MAGTLLAGLAALLLLWPGAAAAQAGRRVALVIGNSKYQQKPLANPRNDAAAMARLLRDELGFEVIPGYDLGLRQIEDALKELSRRIEGAEVALFYYAGHGVQVDGRNYLVPVDNLARDAADLDRMVALESVQSRLGSAQQVNILFIDACRDNPFLKRLNAQTAARRSTAGVGGLAGVRAGGGTLIAFATAPDRTAEDGAGEHSPFTAALLEHLRTPELEVTEVMRRVRRAVIEATKGAQQPWDVSSLVADFYFKQPPTTLPRRDLDMEVAAWAKAEAGDQPELLKTYLRQFPKGAHAQEAKQRLAVLSQTPEVPSGGSDVPPLDSLDRAASAVLARVPRPERLVTGGFTYGDTRMPTACGRELARRVGASLGGTVLLANLRQIAAADRAAADGDAVPRLRDEDQFGLPAGEGTWLLEGRYAPGGGGDGIDDDALVVAFELIGRGPDGKRLGVASERVPLVPARGSKCRGETPPPASALTQDRTSGPLRLELSSPLGRNPVYAIREPPERVEFQLRVSGAPNAHLYCLNRDAEARTQMLVPNARRPDSRIPGGKTLLVPTDLQPTTMPGALIAWEASAETVEIVKCFASERPLALPFPLGDLSREPTPILGLDEAGLLRAIRGAAGNGALAEASVVFAVVPE